MKTSKIKRKKMTKKMKEERMIMTTSMMMQRIMGMLRTKTTTSLEGMEITSTSRIERRRS